MTCAKDNGAREPRAELLKENEALRRRIAKMEQAEADLKRAEQELGNAQQTLLNIIEFLPDATLVLDQQKRVIAWNRAIEEMTGVHKKEIIGIGDYAYAVPFYGKRRPMLVDLVGIEDRALESQYRYVRRQGSTLYAEVFVPCLFQGKGAYVWATASPLWDSAGNRIGAIESVRDISERWRLEKQILEIRQREQRRIGQDLHDGLCQHLKSIELMTAALEQRLTEAGSDEAAPAASIAKLVNEAIAQTRNVARGLSPIQLESRGLVSALQELATRQQTYRSVPCYFRCDAPVHIEDNMLATNLYRIAQEAVQNAVKHAKPKQILIDLHSGKDGIILTIRDDGRGLPERAGDGEGMGLHIMNYRARMIGATLDIQPDPAGGTQVTCCIPKKTREGKCA